MVSKDDHKLIIWPSYFDKNLSISKGRKVPKKNSFDKPDVEKIAKIAKNIGLSVEIERNASHPTRPWKREGRIITDKIEKKRKIIDKISKKL